MASTKNIQHRPLVSIGIPTYNRADGYLREALQSALRQAYDPLEIIVSDNGSTDGTEQYVTNINDPRIRYFRQQEALSPNDNFNFCLNKAQGVYFLLLHDDDIIDDDFIEACMNTAGHGDEVGVIRTGTRIIDARSRAVRNIPNQIAEDSPTALCRAWFNGKISFYFCSTLYNTQRLKQNGGFYSKHNLLQDCSAIIELAVQAKRIDIAEVKASFREHANYVLYGRILKRWVEDFLWLLDRICWMIPEDAAALRSQGARFFSALNYKRARVIASPLKRVIAHFYVFRKFGYKYPPPQIGNRLRRLTSNNI
jgi:glycosyltransferase involved in cell wall biosynthesis